MSNLKLTICDTLPSASEMYAEIVKGLAGEQKSISPKYFYDRSGSRLFDRICGLPEYYATRTEINILESYADEISTLIAEDSLLIELGSGSSEKVRLLLDALKPITYMPVDISKDYLVSSAQDLAEDYPWLSVHAMCLDYTASMDIQLEPEIETAKKVVFYPGSSIGNFTPEQTHSLLTNINQLLGDGGVLLIGVDLKKEENTLLAAYNDSQGITSQFNKNVLARINRELGADFDIDNYSHQAFYNNEFGRIEMHLVSEADQIVNMGDQRWAISEGESIHTENSYKYTIEEFDRIARRAGFNRLQSWLDDQQLFSVHCFTAIDNGGCQ
ncbi:MAG: L-histidine N(alpha)-methyltransferase [Gammaproteobacteria bacterium]